MDRRRIKRISLLHSSSLMIFTMMGLLEYCIPKRLPRPPAKDVERTVKEVPLNVGLLAGL